VRGFRDLIELAGGALGDRCAIVAQSMGGAVAIGLALRHPVRLDRLVLVATSGGIELRGLGAAEWRPDYCAQYPRAAPWVWQDRLDYTDSIPSVQMPTLLIWGDADPISPVAVGRRLAQLLPAATLSIVAGGTHSLAHDDPDHVAALILGHLR
jgi:pimeloyl-ACP methyl ester carboxylesterase